MVSKVGCGDTVDRLKAPQQILEMRNAPDIQAIWDREKLVVGDKLRKGTLDIPTKTEEQQKLCQIQESAPCRRASLLEDQDLEISIRSRAQKRTPDANLLKDQFLILRRGMFNNLSQKKICIIVVLQKQISALSIGYSYWMTARRTSSDEHVLSSAVSNSLIMHDT